MKKLSLFLLFITATFISTATYAATVQKIIKKKRVVVIDTGKNDGANKGDRYCFYNTKNKRVACGKIVKANRTKSYVRVSKKRLRRIKSGYEARPREAAIAKSNMANFKSGPGAPTKGRGHNVKLVYSLGLLPQTRYDLAGYSPETFVTRSIVWEKCQNIGEGNCDEPTPLSVLGGGGEFEYALSPSMSVAVGARFKIIETLSIDTSRFPNNQNPNEFVRSEVTGTGIGGWVDFYFLNINLFKNAGIKIGGGLDLELASVEATGFLMDDNDPGKKEAIIEGTSSGMILSVRVPIDLYYNFGSFGVGARIVPMFAAVAFGITNEATLNDPNAPADAQAVPVETIQTQYIEEALELRTGGLALEILPISFIYNF